MASAIGNQTFLQMTGPPPNVAQQIEVEAHAGIDGNALWKTGTRGKPFQVETLVDLASLAACNTQMRIYESLIGKGPHLVVWANNVTIKVEVLDVQPLRSHLAITAIGGLNSGVATLRAQWTLIPLN